MHNFDQKRIYPFLKKKNYITYIIDLKKGIYPTQGNSDDLHTLTAISALQGYVITLLATSKGTSPLCVSVCVLVKERLVQMCVCVC